MIRKTISNKSIIKFTKSAITKLYLINKQYNTKYINIGVKSGGCSGFQYYIDPSNKDPDKLDELVKLDVSSIIKKDNNIDNTTDNTIDNTTDDNMKNSINISICGNSMFKLIGTELDWEESIMGEQFVFKNPNAEFKCGCGKSFN